MPTVNKSAPLARPSWVFQAMPRYPQLDGWGAVGILCVMAAHMVPPGPKRYRLNEMVAEPGMCIFFTLSGYLITTTLLYRPRVSVFLVAHPCRILPLAWLFLLVVLPLLAIAVTIFRIWNGVTASNVTYYRIDEVFAGATLSLLSAEPVRPWIQALLSRIPPYCAWALLSVCCHVAMGIANRSMAWLQTRPLAYIAAISYPLYILHPLTTHGAWFDPPDKTLTYLRRPIGFALSFRGAHLSTNYYENRWIALGKVAVAAGGRH